MEQTTTLYKTYKNEIIVLNFFSPFPFELSSKSNGNDNDIKKKEKIKTWGSFSNKKWSFELHIHLICIYIRPYTTNMTDNLNKHKISSSIELFTEQAHEPQRTKFINKM